MPDSDRLQQLRRQRTLVAEQLAWLDREIATASGSPAPTSPAPPTPTPAPPSVQPAMAAPIAPPPEPAPILAVNVSPPTPDATTAAEAMLDEYRVAPDALKSDVKKGCFLYFFAALGLFALGMVALYFTLRHGQ